MQQLQLACNCIIGSYGMCYACVFIELLILSLQQVCHNNAVKWYKMHKYNIISELLRICVLFKYCEISVLLRKSQSYKTEPTLSKIFCVQNIK